MNSITKINQQITEYTTRHIETMLRCIL